MQKGLSRTLPGIEQFNNEERLGRLDLFPLERRLRENMIEVYKMERQIDRGDCRNIRGR